LTTAVSVYDKKTYVLWEIVMLYSVYEEHTEEEATHFSRVLFCGF